jgi:hypothetical protein
MTKDLPDFRLETQAAVVTADKLKSGADASKPASPTVGDVYLATDTKKLYICVADGAWTGFDASILVQGVLTLYANMLGGGYRLTNIADPTADQDAATRAYVDGKLDDITQSQPLRALGDTYQNTSGKIRIVAVAIRATLSSSRITRTALCDASSTPTTVVASISLWEDAGLSDSRDATFVFVVPPNYYYTVATTSETLVSWTEWDIL